MSIPFNHFEEMISEAILNRGLSYYENGLVSDVAKISDNEYEIAVSGTEEYTVYLKIEDDEVIEHFCDCPYDMGPVCKHIVASMYYLKENEFRFNNQSESSVKMEKGKSVTQQLNEILEKISYQELKEFIVDQGKTDKQFRNLFLSTFSYLDDSQSKKFYQKQINSIVNSSTDRHGFIGWHEMSKFEKAIYPIICNADKQFEDKNYKIAYYICTALMEEMTKAIQFSDDSNGVIGGIINNSHGILDEIASEDLPKDFRDEFFNYCITAFEQQLFEGWDWHIGILYTAYEFVENENEADRIIKCLDKIEGQYEKERAQSFKLQIITAFKGKEEVQKFIDKHIANSSIRNAEIEKAFANKEFDRAIKLSKEGIDFDKQDKPGLVKKWYNWLLKVAQIQNNNTKIIEYARYLFIDNFYPEQDYYQILKQEIEPDKWDEFLEEIIEEISPKDGWKYDELVRKIYINEKWWDRLFLLLKQNASLQNIQNNEQYLAEDYSQELIQLYSERLTRYVDKYVGRNHYQSACSYLIRMKKLGGVDEVNRLIETFREKYPRRRALMDELNKV